MIVVAACTRSRNPEAEANTPTAAPDLSATAMPTEATSVPEPETPSPMPRPDEAAETATPEPPTPRPEPVLPVLGSMGSVPISGCVVYPVGRVTDEELLYVRSGPGTAFGVLGQFGGDRWATRTGMQDGWLEIIVGPGETGWIQEAGVGTNGQCDTASGPAAVPINMNRGAPANSRCVAMIPGSSTELPAVYLAADDQSTVVARLGNWADVQEVNADWYSVTLLGGATGWVKASTVELSMGCGTSGPIRIEFAVGTTATTIEGKLPAQAQVEYVFRAAAGQQLELSVTSPENSILVHVEGVEDGQVVKHLLDGESSWQGTVPSSQDYLLTVDNAGSVASYSLYVSIENEP